MNSSRGTSRIARVTVGERTPRCWIWCATMLRRNSLRSAISASVIELLPASAMPLSGYALCGDVRMEMRANGPRTQAAAILDDFAARTGLSAPVKPQRYLWTDAFALMTWIGLHEETGDAKYLDLASRLLAQVHEVLGVSRDPEH